MKRLMIYSCAAMIACTACSEKNAAPECQDQVKEFTISVNAGADTRITTSLEDKTFKFAWSDDDSLCVFVLPGGERNAEENQQSFIFHIKSGAGTSSAIFSCSSPELLSALGGVEKHTLAAVYGKTGNEAVLVLDDMGNVSKIQKKDGDSFSNISENVVLRSWVDNVTIDSVPSFTFSHMTFILKICVKNVGADDIQLQSIDFPYGEGRRYWGEQRGLLQLEESEVIPASSEAYYYVSIFETSSVNGRHDKGWDDWSFKLNLVDGRQIVIDKDMGDYYLNGGRVYKTTLNVKSSMATSGNIPDMGEGENDDF